jgi:TonB family protein
MIYILNSIADTWWSFYSIMQIQNSLFLLIVICIFYLVRKQSFPHINFISLIVILKFAIPPFLKASATFLPLYIISSNTILNPIEQPIIENHLMSITSIIFSIWILMVTFFVVIIIKKFFSLRPIVKHSQFLKNIYFNGKKVPVLLSDNISVPLITGFVQYKIILPKWFLDSNKAQQELILWHELAHINFKDHWLKLFEISFIIIYLPNPLVLFLFKKIAYFRELRCDEWAIKKLNYTHKTVADDLVYFAEKIKDATSFISLNIGFWQSRSSLFHRIKFHLFRKESAMLNKRLIQNIIIMTLISLFIVFSCNLTQVENSEIFEFSEVDKRPEIIQTVQPDYPVQAQENGIEGRVTVKIIIDTKGNVEKAEVIKSIPGLDEAALEAAKKVTFSPAEKDGNPVKVSMTIPFSFNLK